MAYIAPNIRCSESTIAQLLEGGFRDHLTRIFRANLVPLGPPERPPSIVADGGGAFGGRLASGRYSAVSTRYNGLGESTPSPRSESFAVVDQDNPSVAATVDVVGGGIDGGLLAPGTYRVAYTFVDSVGESAIGESESESFVIARQANPTVAATVVADGGGADSGLLAPGTYRAAYTFVVADPVGETTIGDSESTTFVVALQPNPTVAATVSPDGGGVEGGLLAAGSYRVAYTFVVADMPGETTIGTSESEPFVAEAGKIPRVALPAVPAWADSIKLYLTPIAGASGSETLYASGITGTTYDLSAAHIAGATIPGSNSTTANIPRITFPALPDWADSINLYLTSPGGVSGSETLYASGITTTTHDCTLAATIGGIVPTANTTTTSIPRVSLPDVPTWADSIKLYLTLPGGESGSERLYASGITATPHDLAVSAPTGAIVPAVNTTSSCIPRITLGDLVTGQISHRLYLTPAGGAPGSEVFYAGGITAATYDATHSLTSIVPPPPVDETGCGTFQSLTMTEAIDGNISSLLRDLENLVDVWRRGTPISSDELTERVLDYAVIFNLINTAIEEMATLIAENPGTLTAVGTNITRIW